MPSIDQITKFLGGEIAVIWQAPVAFFSCVIAAAVLIWIALRWRYSTVVEHLGQRISLRDAQIDDYKMKLSGATPDEAKKRIDALELAVVRLSPRRLGSNEQSRLLTILSRARATILISYDIAVVDSKRYSLDFETVFREAGWDIMNSGLMGIGNSPPSGVALKVKNPASLNAIELLVKSTLEAVEVEFDVQDGLHTAMQPQPPHPYVQNPDVQLIFSARTG